MTELQQVFDESPIAIYTCDHNGYVTFYNRAAVALWGRAPQIGKDLWCGSWKIYFPDGRPMPLDTCPMALTLKERIPYENRRITIERPDGSFRNLRVFPRPLFDSNGRLTGAHNTLIDVTETHEQDIRNAMLAAIVESSDDAIISKNLDGTITSWNRGAERIFGYSQDEIIGKPITTLIPLSRRNEEHRIIDSIKDGRKVDHFQTMRCHKAGHEIIVSLTVSPIKDANENIVGASKIARDITDQVKAQEIIKRYTENLETLNAIGKGISEKLDIEAILQRVTEATTKITGAAFGAFFYNIDAVEHEAFTIYVTSGIRPISFEKISIPRNLAIFHPTFKGQGALRLHDITGDPRFSEYPTHFGLPEQYPRVVSYLSMPVILNSGIVIGGLFFGHPEPGKFTSEHEDIIGSIASQVAVALDNAQLFERVRLLSAQKDEFIAIASHELKTPLTSVKGFLQVLTKRQQNDVERRFLEKSLIQVERLNTLVDDMLNMSKIEAGKLEFNIETFDMSDLVQDIVGTFKHTHATHKIVSEVPPAPVFVEADKQRIEQAMINLIGNAIKYSPNADLVNVKLFRSNESLTFSVEDYGIGLTEEQQQKAFLRFYRADGNKGISGLGLGLYLTKQIVDRHDGSLKVSSKFGAGSTFYFTLPLSRSKQ
ncbi:PAS domain S-box protein [Parapedobacter deserti]|uniref:histidine kinase n=1 Tax=Parapedobacter deserti TaxID=1912957 RepID=A0ABV7JRL5_9SPHI